MQSHRSIIQVHNTTTLTLLLDKICLNCGLARTEQILSTLKYILLVFVPYLYISIARYAIQKLHIDSEENEGRDHGASGRFTRGRGIATEPQGASPVVWLKFVTSDAGELHGILDLYYLRFKSCLICMVVDQIKEWLEHSLLDHFIVARLWSGPN